MDLLPQRQASERPGGNDARRRLSRLTFDKTVNRYKMRRGVAPNEKRNRKPFSSY